MSVSSSIKREIAVFIIFVYTVAVDNDGGRMGGGIRGSLADEDVGRYVIGLLKNLL